MGDTHPFRSGLVVLSEGARIELRRFASGCSDAEWLALVRRIAGSLHPAARATVAASTPAAAAVGPETTLAALYADYVRCATPGSVAESSLEELGVPLAKAKVVGAALAAAAEDNRRALASASE